MEASADADRLIVVNRELVRRRRQQRVGAVIGTSIGLMVTLYVIVIIVGSLTTMIPLSGWLFIPFLLIPAVAWSRILVMEKKSGQTLNYLGVSGGEVGERRDRRRSMESLEAERQALLERVGGEEARGGGVSLVNEAPVKGALSVESGDE